MNNYMDKCAGCSCVLNYNDESEYCGKLGRQNGKVTTLGCDIKCPQCKLCKYKKNDQTSTTRNDSNNLGVSRYLNSNNDKKNFLKFLKRQKQLNNKEMGYINNHNNVNGNNNLNDIFNNLNNIDNQRTFEEISKLHEYNKQEIKKKQCIERDINDCTVDTGCGWNKLSDECKELEVEFYTNQKLKGDNFKLKIGNYDLPDIDNFDFLPDYISVPKGLRVKIFHSSGFVGQYDLFIGDYDINNLKDTNLKKINKVGSIQICNMITCSKPNDLGSFKLINVNTNNNIDKINENNMENIEEYKELLKTNIRNRIRYIIKTQKECFKKILCNI